MSRASRQSCTLKSFWLNPKDSYVIHKLDPKSLLAHIQSCYVWHFTVSDHRQVNPIGVVGITVTGVWVKAAIVPGQAPKTGLRWHPRIKRALAEDADGEAAEAEVDDAEGMALNANGLPLTSTRVRQGWRLAFRTEEPDNMAFENLAKRMGLKAQVHSLCMRSMVSDW